MDGPIPKRLESAKAQLRQQLRTQRARLPASTRAAAARKAARHAERMLRRCQARHVAVYLSFKDELDTGPLLERLQRKSRHIFQIYVPKLRGNRMVFVALKRGVALRRNRFGIAEPVTSQRAHRLDAMVLPLLGFDRSGQRLGQGGGYYDRALARPRTYRRPLRLGYAYALQEIVAVPAGSHDARMDVVITERGALWAIG